MKAEIIRLATNAAEKRIGDAGRMSKTIHDESTIAFLMI
jgi:hypothetical protein